MLQELLTADPDLARRFRLPSVASAKEGQPLAGTALPFVGGVCSTNASDVGFVAPDSATKRTFGGNCGSPDFYFPSKLGIGTTSPNRQLDVYGGSAEAGIIVRTGTTSWFNLYQPFNT
ncbi:MAG: hypothetical protein ACRD88_08240, partial [Terriglobia bacterium]